MYHCSRFMGALMKSEGCSLLTLCLSKDSYLRISADQLGQFRAPGHSAAWGTSAGNGKHFIQLALVFQCDTDWTFSEPKMIWHFWESCVNHLQFIQERKESPWRLLCEPPPVHTEEEEVTLEIPVTGEKNSLFPLARTVSSLLINSHVSSWL